MEFKKTLKCILTDLSKHKGNDRAKLIEYYINKRLNDSLVSYYNTLNESIEVLNEQDALKVLKKINKEN